MKVEKLHGSAVMSSQLVELERLIQEDSACIFGPFGFQKSGRVVVTSAPARLDIMGGIADYCGANVFEMTLSRTATVISQAREDRNIRAVTLGIGSQFFLQTPHFETEENIQWLGNQRVKSGFQISLDDFYSNGNLKTYSEIHELLSKNSMSAWVGYILGAFYVLLKEGWVDQFKHGAAIILSSNIPSGTGIASSAAIEVAALMGINRLYNLNLSELELAIAAQIVENRVVGAPCGIMDQVTVTSGTSEKVLSIRCQPRALPQAKERGSFSGQTHIAEAPYEILEYVSCPMHVSFIGIDTKAPRSTTSDAYIDTRTAAFMGLTILQHELKFESNYLCNLSVQEFHERCEPLLPERMHGAAFLTKYGETVDTVTSVSPEKVYAIRNCVQHPIYENARVKQFITALKNVDRYPERRYEYLREAGELMYESNKSYRELAGLGSPEVDGLINIVRKIGEQGGIYGAKITGGGGGGTVALLCYGTMSPALTQILAAYKLAWGLEADSFIGTAPGAYEFDHHLWELKESEPLTHF